MLTAQQVIRILEAPALQHLNFQCGSTRVYTAGYSRVASAIRSRRIQVRPAPATMASPASYAPTNLSSEFRANTLYVKPNVSDQLLHHRALIVHEATHALQDYQNNGWAGRIDKETAAFTAQAFYYEVIGRNWLEYAVTWRTEHPAQFERPDAPQDWMMEVTQRVAHRIRATPGAYHVTRDEFLEIFQSIVDIPLYADKAADTLMFDGI